jgi:hypothetical protein
MFDLTQVVRILSILVVTGSLLWIPGELVNCDHLATVTIQHVDPHDFLAQTTHTGFWQAIVVDRVEDPTTTLPRRFKLRIMFFAGSDNVRQTEQGGVVLDEEKLKSGVRLTLCVPRVSEVRRCRAPAHEFDGKMIYYDEDVADKYDQLPCYRFCGDWRMAAVESTKTNWLFPKELWYATELRGT